MNKPNKKSTKTTKRVHKVNTNALTNTIIKYLNLKGYFAFRVNNMGVWDSKKNSYRANATMKGISDIIAIVNGEFWGIEVKNKDKQSINQMYFQERVENAGGKYIIARSLDDVINAGI